MYGTFAAKVGFVRGVNDSALVGLMSVLSEDTVVGKNVAVKYRWNMNCSVCHTVKEDRCVQKIYLLTKYVKNCTQAKLANVASLTH